MRFLLFILLVAVAYSAPVREDDDSETTKKPEFEVEGKSADLVFLVDVTGSMGSYIDGVKRAIKKIVETSNKKETAMRLSFIGYRDPFGDGEIPRMTETVESANFEIQPFTSSIKVFTDFVSKVRATGGGDGPEDVFGGLEKAGEIEWNPEASKRVLFLIADAPAHGEEFGGWGGFNEGDPLKRDLKELLKPIKEGGADLIFGRVNRDTDTMVERLGEAWGKPLRSFPVSGNSGGGRRPRPFGLPGAPARRLMSRGPAGFRGAAGRSASGFAAERSESFAADLDSDDDIADKIATAVEKAVHG